MKDMKDMKDNSKNYIINNLNIKEASIQENNQSNNSKTIPDEPMRKLKESYESQDIPEELDQLVRTTLKNVKVKSHYRKWIGQLSTGLISTVASAAALLIITVNISPTAAKAMAEVPAIGSFVKVVTFREYNYKDDHHEAQVNIPQVTGLSDKALEDMLNQKYLEENTKLYEEFMKKIGTDNLGDANIALFSDYKVILDTDSLLVLASEKTEIAASGSESIHYDTIDKKNQLVLTLSSLFKDSGYIDKINENIITQMKEQMKGEEGKVYFLEDGIEDDFKSISSNQNFYINEDGKLVISFNEYDVAPGFMGVVEFVIPTDIIKDLLVSDYYIH